MKICFFVLNIFLGFTVSAFEIPNSLENIIHKNKSEYLLVHFWSPSCEPCGKEVNEVNQSLKIYTKLSALGVPLQARKSAITEFIKYYKPDYEQWTPDLASKKTLEQTITAVPYTLLLDQKRKIIKEWSGVFASKNLTQTFEQLAKEKEQCKSQKQLSQCLPL